MTAPAVSVVTPMHDEEACVEEFVRRTDAALAAIEGNYGIECDVQITADNEAMVFHDDTLDRLTASGGPLVMRSAADLQRVPFKRTSDRMATLGEYCDLIAGRSLLLIELKSRFDGDLRIARRAVEVMRGYKGPFALMFQSIEIAVMRKNLAAFEVAPMYSRTRFETAHKA